MKILWVDPQERGVCMGAEDLFKKLSSRMARVGRSPNAKGSGGNPTKRIQTVRVSKVSEEQLTAALGTEYKTLQEVAGVLGITGERVRQLINERGITRVPRPAKTYPTCKICNQPNFNHRGVEWRSRQFRTHHTCMRITLTCPQCDNEFSLYRSAYSARRAKRDRIFCSRSCFWSWRWKNDSEWRRKPHAKRGSRTFEHIIVGQPTTKGTELMARFSKQFEVITLLVAVDDYGNPATRATALDFIVPAVEGLNDINLIDYGSEEARLLTGEEGKD